jgi:hypothetical protein
MVPPQPQQQTSFMPPVVLLVCNFGSSWWNHFLVMRQGGLAAWQQFWCYRNASFCPCRLVRIVGEKRHKLVHVPRIFMARRQLDFTFPNRGCMRRKRPLANPLFSYDGLLYFLLLDSACSKMQRGTRSICDLIS